MGRPKGSVNKTKQSVQQDMQQAAMIATKQQEKTVIMHEGGYGEVARPEGYVESYPIQEQQAMETITKAAKPILSEAFRANDAVREANRLAAMTTEPTDQELAKAESLSSKMMSAKQRADILALCHELKTTTLFKQNNLPEDRVTYAMADVELRRLRDLKNRQVAPKVAGAVSKQTGSQAVASMWTKNTDDFPEDLNSLAKIDARKILGVPFICVGIEEKVGGPDSLNPGKPFWTMQLLFDGTGDEEFSCNVSGGYLANQIKRIAQFVSYEHPLYRTFELVPEYITATDKIQNKQYPPYWLKQWRSVRGEYDVTFAY